MEIVQNAQQHEVTRSNLSDWVGDEILTSQSLLSGVRVGEDRALPNHSSVDHRMYSVISPSSNSLNDTINVGPGDMDVRVFPIHRVFQNPALEAMSRLYSYVSYDSVDVTISMSDPKGLLGAFVAGYYPYVPWFQTRSSSLEASRHSVNDMTKQRLMLSPESHLAHFSAAQDVKFSVPWTLPSPHVAVEKLWSNNAGISQFVNYGEPVLYVCPLAATSLDPNSEVTAKVRMYVKFNNLRWFGAHVTSAQSGLETAMAIGAGLAVESAVSAGAEIVSDAVSTFVGGGVDDDEVPDSYNDPIAVQPAYVGDSTRVGPPPNTPIFTRFMRAAQNDSVHKFLSTPQYLSLFQFPSTGPITLWANPVDPYGGSLSNPNGTATYFNFFSQMAQFWRGTINFHFVICGHPFVEVEYVCSISYPDRNFQGFNMGTFQVLKGVCSGNFHIKVPMPYLNYLDHLPILDLRTADITTEIRTMSSSLVNFDARIVGSNVPFGSTVPVLIFMSAGEDFEFSQPFSVGLNHTENVRRVQSKGALPPIAGSKNSSITSELQSGTIDAAFKVLSVVDCDDYIVMHIRVGTDKHPCPPAIVYVNCDEYDLPDVHETQAQVGLVPPNVVFQTNAKTQENLDFMPSIGSVTDFANIWSRSLPYSEYDADDEPIADITFAGSPVSWPTYGGSAAWTANVNNSWFVTCDYLAMVSSMYLYYKGSIGLKVIVYPDTDLTEDLYKFVSLQPVALSYRQRTNNPYTFRANTLPFDANFGNGSVVTPREQQPVIDLTVPFRSPLAWNAVCHDFLVYCDSDHYPKWIAKNLLYSNCILQIENDDLVDMLYRKAGPDYQLAVQGLLPPAPLWVARGFDWM